MKHLLPLILFIALTCPATALATSPDWRFDLAEADLRTESCASAETKVPFTAVPLNVQSLDINSQSLTGATLAGAWAFRSDDPELGGLSGLSLMETGDLLAISDTGRFFQIYMQDGRPTGQATKAGMRFENRLIRPSKLTADAEGLDYRNGLAIVSFERNFRVLAFDIGQCGAAARGVTLAKPPKRYDEVRIRANSGPEALTLSADGGLTIGYEQVRNGRAVTAQILSDGNAKLSETETDPLLNPGFRLVGLDHLRLRNAGTVSVQLMRAYDRDTGSRSMLMFTTDGVPALSTVTLLPPMLVDNFEGITLQETESGIRAFIISDDNFSDRQQTLLYALDINWPS